jgi:hypothetical protein
MAMAWMSELDARRKVLNQIEKKKLESYLLILEAYLSP